MQCLRSCLLITGLKYVTGLGLLNQKTDILRLRGQVLLYLSTWNALTGYHHSPVVSVHGPNHPSSLGGTLSNGSGPDRQQEAILEPSEKIVAVDGSQSLSHI